ncbi:MAG: ribose-phosphate pyrophosphokinase [Methanoregulaceae archaeon]
MAKRPKLVVLSGSSNAPLSREICEELDVPLTPVNIERFSNENISIQITESVRRKAVFIVQSLYPHPNTMLVELMLLVDAARSASAAEICVVMPHYSYARSDKKDKPRISIAAKLFARTLEAAGADRFLTMTLHSEHVQGFFDRPIDHLLGSQVVCEFLRKRDLSNAVALFDLGQDKRAGSYAEELSLPMAVYDKRRVDDTTVEIRSIVGEIEGKDVWVFDDEIASGTSIVAIANAIRAYEPASVRVACTHGLFCGRAPEILEGAPVEEVVTTNTIDIPEDRRIPKLTILSVAPLIARAIERTAAGKSVSGLFRK